MTKGVLNKAYKETYKGEKLLSKSFGEFEIIDWVDSKHVKIRFSKTGFERVSLICDVRRGALKDPLFPTVYGVGFIGVGKYTARSGKGLPNSPCYDSWRGMLRRCYSEESSWKNPTYFGCTVTEYWHNYQNFAEWYYSNLISADCAMVDKDILKKGNKVYSPDNCCLVSSQVNSLMTGATLINRGKYPLGVFLRKRNGNFVSQVTRGAGQQEFLGEYSTPEEAFLVYKVAKEAWIKEVANEFKGKISAECFNALNNWQISIND